MSSNILVSTHLSSLYSPSQVPTISIHTSRRNTPLPPSRKNSDPAEHALSSSLFNSAETGTILVRLIHDGLILELVPLTTNVPPIRFVFPSPVSPSPAVFLFESRELHVLAVTTFGSLYRLVLPLRSETQLWSEQMSHNWCREYQIKNMQEAAPGIVQVQGLHCVAIALHNGSLIRLDTDFIGDNSLDDQWTESLFHHTSFLSSLASFLPGHQGSDEGSHVVSICSHPQPTDMGHIWTLSRDRTLRLWTARSGCVSTRMLPSSSSNGRETSPLPGSSTTGKANVFLDPEPQRLLSAFSIKARFDGLYVLAFIPTPSSTVSGGFFQLFTAANDSLLLVETIESAKDSVHCHLQDFFVAEGRLYALWDCQARSSVHSLDLPLSDHDNISDNIPSWHTAAYPPESELTPTYLDELLLSPGSMTDKFFSAIMQPGVFSPLTLRTAIDQYTDACLSLPGTPSPQLTSSYASVADNITAVVGCTVSLSKDPLTGAPLYDQYWISLKRDWEGFIARCREIERSARWPLAIGVGNPDVGDVVIIERERAGILAQEDLALHLHRALCSGVPLEPQYALSEIAWTLRSKLGARLVQILEGDIHGLVHEEIAFSLADVIHNKAQHSIQDIDEGLESWILGGLQSIDDLDTATRLVLDIAGGFDTIIKREEEDTRNLPRATSEWALCLITAYLTYTIHARYEFIMCLIILVFFLSEDLPQWDPSLLAEIFAVFRGVTMLRYTSQQSSGNGVPSTAGNRGSFNPDDVVSRLRSLDVSRGSTTFASNSLLHNMLARIGSSGLPLPGVAHDFLDRTGLLQDTSPAHASMLNVVWCDHLRLMGNLDVAREMLEWLPRTPAVMYVWARLWLNVGRDEDAATAFDSIAGSFGPNNALSYEDSSALQAVLPGAKLFDSDFGFYVHASALFKSESLIKHEIHFSRLALSVAPPEWETAELWYCVIKGSIDLGYYDDAYSALMSAPHDRLKRDCIRQLVYRMCEEHAIEQLVSFSFGKIVDEVEESLSFKARNADPHVRPFYSRILYTWYISRGDYRKAALVMYQRATKLSTVTTDLSQFISIVEQQLEAYSVSMNALSLLDQKNAWIVLPISSEISQPARKRRKLTKHIPENSFSNGKRDSEIVELSDIVYEYTLLSARLELVRRDGSLLPTSEVLLSPSSVVLRLAQANRFNTAMATARTLQVDMTDTFSLLTRQCLRLSHSPDAVLSEDTSDWLLTDKVTSWPGTPADRGWRYLKQCLQCHDSAETDMSYSKVVFETILSFDRSSPPPWLVQSIEEFHPDWLIRIYLRFGIFESVLDHTTSLIRTEDTMLSRNPPKTAMSTWLPYTLIDQVLVATADGSSLSARAQVLRQILHTELSNRTKRMQKLSQL